MENSIRVVVRSIQKETFSVADMLHMATGFGLSIYSLEPSKGNEWIISALTEGKQVSTNLSSAGTVEIHFTVKAEKFITRVEKNQLKVAAYVDLPNIKWMADFLASGTMTGYRINSKGETIRFYAEVPCSIIGSMREERIGSDR